MTDVARSRSKTACRPTSDTPHADDELDAAELERQLEQHRRELTGYCYRMLGSAFEAEDAVQETMVRAWRASTASRAGRRCARGCTASPPTSASTCSTAASAGPARWTSGRPRRADAHARRRAARGHVDRADPRRPGAARRRRSRPRSPWPRESIRLAFVAALQHLPPRQRAVLILREVLRWQADEVAELLDTTVASVNSALQRARATLGEHGIVDADAVGTPRRRRRSRSCSARYVDAFERYDIDGAHRAAPRGRHAVDAAVRPVAAAATTTSSAGCSVRVRRAEGSRLVAGRRQRLAGVRPVPAERRRAGHEPWALQVLEIADGADRRHQLFLDTERCSRCSACPPHLD